MSYFEQYYDAISYPIATEDQKGLRRPQLGAIHQIASYFTIKQDPAIVTMPTGSGKTAVLMMAAFILRAERVLVVTPCKLVRNQIKEQFKSLSLLKDIGALSQNIPDPNIREIESKINGDEEWEQLREYDIVVGTPNSVSPGFEDIPDPPEDLFDLLLIDEAHHSPARTWREILSAYPTSKKILFTATPFRRDKKEIHGNFIYTYPLREAYKDKIFGKIDYIPATKEMNESNDIATAKETAKIFYQDKSSGYKHFIMVRTDTKARADELKRIYEDNTDLKLQTIHSNHTYKFIKRTIENLKLGHLDGIISVNMLGEGFDFPNLKIAAVHSPHKSLAVTLQFIGRFARTGDGNIGTAKFVAVPQDIEIESKRLYEEDSIWQELVENLSQSKIEQEQNIRETLDKFKPHEVTSVDTEDISLYALYPYFHVKIYQGPHNINVSKDISFPENFEIVYKSAAGDISTVVYLTKETVKSRWTNIDSFNKIEYDLFIIYYDSESNLLFINATRRLDSIYENIADQLTDKSHKILPLRKINKVLIDLENPEFFNIGMKNSVQNNNSESYRIITGASAQNALSNTDGRLYHRGHIFGKAFDGENSLTIGYSSSSKVWSNKTSQIPNLIDWCKTLAKKIMSQKEPVTKTGLDVLSVGKEVTEIPPAVLTVDWDAAAYKSHISVIYDAEHGGSRTGQLIDLELNIDRENSSIQKIRIIVKGEEIESHIDFAISDSKYFKIVEGKYHNIIIKNKGEELSLINYINNNPLNFYFADFSRLRGTELFSPYSSSVEPFDIDRVSVIDWENENVDITSEVSSSGGKLSIHDFLKDYLSSDNDIVFYDHGSGEIADFVTFKNEADEVDIRLYHCKRSINSNPGSRVADVYEVCGQVVKCQKWLNKSSDLFDRIKLRNDKNSEFIKGSLYDLKNIYRDNIPKKYNRFQVILVQPGISKGGIEDNISRVLAASDDYLRRALSERLLVLASM